MAHAPMVTHFMVRGRVARSEACRIFLVPNPATLRQTTDLKFVGLRQPATIIALIICPRCALTLYLDSMDCRMRVNCQDSHASHHSDFMNLYDN
jgi:hypothetical protein